MAMRQPSRGVRNVSVSRRDAKETIMASIKVVRPTAVVDPPRANLALVAFAQKVEQKLTNNTNFPNVGTVVTDLTAARTTYSAVLTTNGTQKDMGDACSSARRALIDKLSNAKVFVNGVAQQAPPDQALAIIESSGFRCRKVIVRTQLPIEVKYGGLSGAVLLVALGAGRSAVYYFQVSTDQKTWTACPNVMKCKTTLAGLTVGTTCYFRVQVQTTKGLGDWSMVVSFVVR
jgi:hypothetical protein